MKPELADILVSLSGRLSRDGNRQIIARVRNGHQQIYILTPSTLPRSPTQLSNSSRFRTAVAMAKDIYHDPEARAEWQSCFDLSPDGYASLFTYIIGKLTRSDHPPDG